MTDLASNIRSVLESWVCVYIDLTVPFASPFLLQIHFDRHGHEFGATSEEDYERKADEFMSRPPTADIYDGQCVNHRPTGVYDRIRLHGTTRWFAVAYGVQTIRTFHVTRRNKIIKAGGPRAFVDQQCLETF